MSNTACIVLAIFAAIGGFAAGTLLVYITQPAMYLIRMGIPIHSSLL